MRPNRRGVPFLLALIVLLSGLYSLARAADDVITTPDGKSTWADGAAGLTKANVRNNPPLADVRVANTVIVNQGVMFADVSYTIGTVDNDGQFNPIAAYFRRVNAGTWNVTNDFKDMPRGVQYTVQVKVEWKKVGMAVTSKAVHTDRTITP